jgi:hypothetical protein
MDVCLSERCVCFVFIYFQMVGAARLPRGPNYRERTAEPRQRRWQTYLLCRRAVVAKSESTPYSPCEVEPVASLRPLRVATVDTCVLLCVSLHARRHPP